MRIKKCAQISPKKGDLLILIMNEHRPSLSSQIANAQRAVDIAADDEQRMQALKRLIELRDQREKKRHSKRNKTLAIGQYIARGNGRHYVNSEGIVCPDKGTLRRQKGQVDPIGERLGNSFRTSFEKRERRRVQAQSQDGLGGVDNLTRTVSSTIKLARKKYVEASNKK